MKLKSVFFCQECGYESPKWMGRCPGCNEWNTLVEEVIREKKKRGRPGTVPGEGPRPVVEVADAAEERYGTGLGELDRVLGGGIVPGSLILVGGDPGIGKSTLLLQVAYAVSQHKGTVLYASGEESAQQIKLQANRLSTLSPRLYVLAENDLELVEKYVRELSPVLVIVDSIQTIYRSELASAPGSVSQVRECTSHLLRLSKTYQTTIIIVGHVTKEGSLAGPRVLEHMVDTVLYLEGERHYSYRILRAVKNRFGSTNEIGVFEMQERGLCEVANPSEMFLAERPLGVAGSAVVASMEGTRPLLVEIQALVTSSSFGQPRRMTTGVDYNRVAMLTAVLDKRVGIHLGNQDIYVNVAGGVRLVEPAVDLGIAVAMASSFRDIPSHPKTLVLGEVGLTGEIRGVSYLEKRLVEGSKLGFTRCVFPKRNLRYIKQDLPMELLGVETLAEALEAVFSI